MRLRSLAVALVCATATVTTVSGVATAHESRTTDRADAAAGWLARQLVDGERFEVDYEGTKYPDQGLTADAVLAFASAGVSGTNGGKAIAWLGKPEILNGYIGNGTTEAYAGATAKISLTAQVRGLNPASFGGVDLPERLRGLLTPSGRFSDRSEFGDYSNAFGQSLAILTLKRTPGGVPTSAIDFAVGTQCPDGGFPIFFGAPTCQSDTDATAMVTQALLATGRTTDAQEGLAWLISRQQANGGISAGQGDAGAQPNTNTTGLAAQALKAGGRHAAFTKAKQFIKSVQVDCAGPVENRGAIPYDATGYNPSTVVRATAQATLGLGGPGLATLSAAGSKPGAPVLACPA